MKRLTTLLFSLALAVTAFAAPSTRTLVTLNRADGTTVEAYLEGDEYCHYYVSKLTGERLTLDENGFVRGLTAKELTRLADHGKVLRSRANRQRMAAPAAPLRAAADVRTESSPFDLHGTRRALVILVEFTDRKFVTDPDQIRRQVNEHGYSDNGHLGSVHDYFADQSYGTFDLEFDVVGPVALNKRTAYYGKNDQYNNDMYPCTMIAEACEAVAANEEWNINFADYDWNDDNEAEMVVVIYAGYGENNGAPASTLWPMQSWLNHGVDREDGPGAMDINGTTIDRYLILNELSGKTGETLEGIGVFCHEYTHGLGLPDFYDTVGMAYYGTSNFGMDVWSLMDRGNYNASKTYVNGKPVEGVQGSAPCGMTAYERRFCGWLDPIELTEPYVVDAMKPISVAPEAYVIRNSGNPDEYFLLQNVQQEGWNAQHPGHGMMILHVDFDEEVWTKNLVNIEADRQRMIIVPADNQLTTSIAGLSGDLFPGTKFNTEFADWSRPAARLYTPAADGRKYLGKPVTEIAEHEADDPRETTISFQFMIEGPIPEGIETVKTDAAATAAYDLAGRRTTPSNGLTIDSNGIKRINK